MTRRNGTGSPPGAAVGKAHQVQDEATKLGHEAVQAGGQVAQQAAGQGRQVAAETRQQARNLLGEASAQLRDQADQQQKRAAGGLRTLGQQLGSMADQGEQDGVASEVVRRGADAAQQAAAWLEAREPGALVQEVRDLARRHPGAFLAGATMAGLLVGRLSRALTAGDATDGRQPPSPDQARSDGGGGPASPAAAPMRPMATDWTPADNGMTDRRVEP